MKLTRQQLDSSANDGSLTVKDVTTSENMVALGLGATRLSHQPQKLSTTAGMLRICLLERFN